MNRLVFFGEGYCVKKKKTASGGSQKRTEEGKGCFLVHAFNVLSLQISLFTYGINLFLHTLGSRIDFFPSASHIPLKTIYYLVH